MWEMISEGIGLLFVCSYVSMMDFFNFYTSGSGIFGALPNIQYVSDRLSKNSLPPICHAVQSGEMGVDYLARQFTAVFDNAQI